MNKQQILKKARNEYMKQWRDKNPDKVQENLKNYWLRKAGVLEDKSRENTNDR